MNKHLQTAIARFDAFMTVVAILVAATLTELRLAGWAIAAMVALSLFSGARKATPAPAER